MKKSLLFKLLLVIVFSGCASTNLNMPIIPDINICALQVSEQVAFCTGIRNPANVKTVPINMISIGMTEEDWSKLNDYVNQLKNEINSTQH